MQSIVKNLSSRLNPISLSIIYLLFTLFWLFGLNIHVNDIVIASQIESGKGILFVIITGSLFYLLLRSWHRQLINAHSKMQDILSAVPDLLFEVDLDGRYHSYHSPNTHLLAAPASVFLGKTIREILPHDAAEICFSALQEAYEKGFSYHKQIELLLPQGKRWFELSVSKKSNTEGVEPHFIVLSRNITDRIIAEQKVHYLGNFYTALNQCNQSIIRSKNEMDLYTQICENIVKLGKMKMAWIGLVDIPTKELKPVAYYGGGTDYLVDLNISIDPNNPSAHGPSGIAFREDKPFWCQNFQHNPATKTWHERGALFGWKSSASLPIHLNGKIVAILNLYASETNNFDQTIQHLLIEMVIDIDIALKNFDTQRQMLKLSQAVEQSPNTIVITDIHANIEYVNATFVKTTGYTLDEVIGKNPQFAHSGKTPSSTYEDMWEHLGRGKNWKGEFINQRKDGTEYIELVHIAPVRQSDGVITHYMAIKEDITDRKEAEASIHHLANFDILTGLPNRSKMDDHFKYTLSLSKRNNETFGVMFLDLDHFKDINDSLGHSIGDELLIELTKCIQSSLREEDTVSRMGGDEFVILLPNTDAQGAAQVAQKLLHAIMKPLYIKHHELRVTASIGIALYPEDGIDMDTLSKNADIAMYRAKHDGRNTYCFSTEEMQKKSARNLALGNALHHALERSELYVVYQPQLSISGTHIIGTESLLRWQHPEFGSVSPAEFIPIAEENGMILPISEWVLRTAIGQAKRWIDDGHSPMIMAVNISAVQFRHPNLPVLITDILQEVGLPPEYLEIELTEGTAMNNPQVAINTMNNLHERGIRMSIDDFGTGYSSLSYLKKFKVYKLKIDQSFVRDISTDPEDKAIVSAVINMARSLGLQTIAEGVETVEQLDYLRAQGCDEIQGYYYSKPISPEQFEAYARKINQV